MSKIAWFRQLGRYANRGLALRKMKPTNSSFFIGAAFKEI